jgi:MSHA biogenesis protein MshJ
MLGLAAVAIGYFAVDMLLVTPQLEQEKNLATQRRTQDTERAAMVALLSSRAATADNVLAQAQRERDSLQATVTEGERVIQIAQRNTDVAPLLRRMVETTPGLRLGALRTAASSLFYQVPPPAPATAKPGDAAPAPATPAVDVPPLHVKAVEATVQGNYLDLLSYLRKLGEHPQPLYWDTATISVGNYPDASLRLGLNLLTTQPDKPTPTAR